MEGPILSTRYQRDLVAKEALTCGHSGPATTTFQSLQRIGQVETGSDMGGGRRIRCDAVQRRHSRLAGPALASLGLYLGMILGRTVIVLRLGQRVRDADCGCLDSRSASKLILPWAPGVLGV